MEGRLHGLDLFNVLADLFDRSCIKREGDEKNYPKKEQNLHPFFFLEIILKIFHNGFWWSSTSRARGF
jgi:hypothetical protein